MYGIVKSQGGKGRIGGGGRCWEGVEKGMGSQILDIREMGLCLGIALKAKETHTIR